MPQLEQELRDMGIPEPILRAEDVSAPVTPSSMPRQWQWDWHRWVTVENIVVIMCFGLICLVSIYDITCEITATVGQIGLIQQLMLYSSCFFAIFVIIFSKK